MGSLPKTPQPLHFVLFPFMAQGHLIPMADIAKLLASRPGVVVTLVTTPINAARVKPSLDRVKLPINLVALRFPCSEAGLPENCETCDMLPSISSFRGIFKAAALMEPQVEALFQTLNPPPSCIVSDFGLPYTNRVAKKFNVPRISFHGFNCFTLLCLRCVALHGEEMDRLSAGSDCEYFVVPGFPGGIRYTREQLPMRPAGNSTDGGTTKEFIADDVMKADAEAYGVIVNTFEELEAEYYREYREAKQGRVWCVGPVSLTNQNEFDKLERGNSLSSSPATARVEECISWLDNQEQDSVMYVCLGSVCNLSSAHLIELALGLEASEKTFVWGIRESDKTTELFEWMAEERFEERISGRGMVIRGWVPQLLILSHPAVGGFLTHCGWNSSLEGISAGIPLVTWPLFADQFSNEKLIVEVAKIGVKVGTERPTYIDGEEVTMIDVTVKKEQVEEAVRLAMNGGKDGEERRKRAKKLATMAKQAVENGGSSRRNITSLIENICRQQKQRYMSESIEKATAKSPEAIE